MAKAIFRHLTGEFTNGWLLSALHNFLNPFIANVCDTFAYAHNMVFKLETEDITGNEIPIRDEDVYGIGKIAGVFVPYISQESNLGCIVFGSSNKSNGYEYSERGLFDRKKELFVYNRMDQVDDDYDLANLATKNQQASFVPHGAPVLGYIWAGDDVLTEDGQIITSAIHAAKPTDNTPYVEFYGEQYLILSETFVQESYLDVETYKKLFEEMQSIRYNGVSVTALVHLKEIFLTL